MGVMEMPETRYAKSGGVHVAYQVVGEAGPTFVGVPGFAQNIEVMWEEPHCARFLTRIASFCRFIHFDKRGTGMSDRNVGVPSFEDRVEDMRAVMDAEGVERAFVGGFSEGGPMSVFFAATYPERTLGLLMLGTAASFVRQDDLPWNGGPEEWTLLFNVWADAWGSGAFSVAAAAPSMVGDEEYLAWAARYERQSLSPGGVIALAELNSQIDVRQILGSVRVPTLVMHHVDEGIDVRNGRYLAEHIPGARFVELPGADHLPWLGDQDVILDEVEEFVTGTRAARASDRILATVLLTDIVGSTERAQDLGDRAWIALLDRHDRMVDAALHRFGGRAVKGTGDGVLATFDSPGRAIRCAVALREDLRHLGIEIRAGVHTGEIETRGDDIGGIGVHIAARVENQARPNEVLVSSSVPPLVVGSGIDFEDRGQHELKGVPGTWQLFAVTD
jgi:class 3 adenylate cyclase